MLNRGAIRNFSHASSLPEERHPGVILGPTGVILCLFWGPPANLKCQQNLIDQNPTNQNPSNTNSNLYENHIKIVVKSLFNFIERKINLSQTIPA